MISTIKKVKLLVVFSAVLPLVSFAHMGQEAKMVAVNPIVSPMIEESPLAAAFKEVADEVDSLSINGAEAEDKSIHAHHHAIFKNLKVKDKFEAHKAKIKHLTVEDDLTIGSGSSSSSVDFVINADISLPNSTVTSGNILKGSSLFLSNFGINNTFLGSNSGNLTMTGSGNVGIGVNVLSVNVSGGNNSVEGNNALVLNTSGSNNSGIGSSIFASNTTGTDNSAVGAPVLTNNNAGSFNSALGSGALQNNSVGTNNTALGYQASFNNAVGSFNIALGSSAGSLVVTGSENIHIGHPGLASDSGVTRIGLVGSQTKAFMAGINGVTTGLSSALPVFVDGNDQLGTISSSRRFKENIERIGKASEALMKLRPVIFNYRADDSKNVQYGLIAEEVAQVYPELVVYDEEGAPYTIKYHLLYALLLNEIQNNHFKIAQQDELLASVEDQLQQMADDYSSQVQALAARVIALEALRS